LAKSSTGKPVNARDEVLKRMLKTPPKPHKDAGHKPAKRVKEVAKLASSVEKNKSPAKVRRTTD
jgi:hypothetical protein